MLQGSYKKLEKKIYSYHFSSHTAQKMEFSITDFFSKFDEIRRELRIWSHLLKKSLMMKNSIFE